MRNMTVSGGRCCAAALACFCALTRRCVRPAGTDLYETVLIELAPGARHHVICPPSKAYQRVQVSVCAARGWGVAATECMHAPVQFLDGDGAVRQGVRQARVACVSPTLPSPPLGHVLVASGHGCSGLAVAMHRRRTTCWC
jgi:hypothetical protein